MPWALKPRVPADPHGVGDAIDHALDVLRAELPDAAACKRNLVDVKAMDRVKGKS